MLSTTYKDISASVAWPATVQVRNRRRISGADGTTCEPLATLVGVWDFDRPEVVLLAPLPIGGQTLHAQLQASLLRHQLNGSAMHAVATYDGIGDDSLHAHNAQL